jgi:hypothetical protein
VSIGTASVAASTDQSDGRCALSTSIADSMSGCVDPTPAR